MNRWSLSLGVGVCLAALGLPALASARIVRVEIEQRGPAFGGAVFGGVGPYELLRGHAYGELDPADPHNRTIVDVSLAPRNARGLVEYRTDILILRPADPARANGRVLFELNNRGDMRAFFELNGSAARTLEAADGAGLGFTMRQGYVIVEAGWDATVAAGPDRFAIQVPTARNADGSPIVGVSLQEFVIDSPDVLRGPLTYKAATLDTGRATLTMRALYSDAPRQLAADAWEFVDDKTIGLLPRGTAFTDGSLYELTYLATDPLVVGVGFAAVRDLATHLRQPGVIGRRAERIYTFGASQPIRFAHDFLKLGFNEGEDGRQVFDGMLNWIGGASGGFFNYRFAQPGRTHRQHIGRWYPEFEFPFANQVLTDSVTGVTDGRMRRCQATGTCPRIFEVNSGNEYWAKAMSLLHTDTSGHDIPDAPDTRSYLLASLPHGPTRQSSLCQQPPNPLTAGPTLRALLMALDEWVTHDTAPPPSRLPRVSDGTLVPAGSPQAVGFPAIPGVVFNGRAHTGDLFDFGPDWRAGILSQIPPTLLGTPYPVLVPKTDGDGLDLGGTFVPGGRSHSASDRAGLFNANARAVTLGAAMVVNVMGVPGNGQFQPEGGLREVPQFTLGMDEGFALRDRLDRGEKIVMSFRLEVPELRNLQTEYTIATLPGASDEQIVVMTHTDGYFQAAMDNASGMASALELARFYAAKPREQRPRTMRFIQFPDHHHGEVARGRKDVGIDATYRWEKVALKLTMEHPSQTLLYMYNDGITPTNAIGAFRWNALGSPAFEQMVFDSLREFGVSVYAQEDGPKNGNYAPSFHIIDHVIYHTSLDVPELVPASGLERSTRAFAAIVDRTNGMTMAELRGSTFPPKAGTGSLTGTQSQR